MSNADVNLDELQLDLKNPRFDGLDNQREALQKIVQSQGTKLVNLAEDIVENGLSPAHRMLVAKATGKGNFGYIVLDGNRRLAALRVLANPAVLDGMTGVGDLTIQKLRRLAKDFSLDAIQPIDVYVCKSESDARHWIEAIHTGENDGRGVVSWDGIATARYRGKNTSLKVLEFVKAAGKLTESELAALERFPITNLDRLLATPEIRELLGLTLEGGDLLSDLPQAELIRPLKKVVNDIASKTITVGQLKGKDDRLKYVNSLKAALPDLSRRTGTPEPLDRLAAHANTKGMSKASPAAKARSLLDRKALIPGQAQTPLNINDQKLQQMCRELRKLPLDTYPVSVAASFRVFLELSLDHYGAEKKVKDYNVDLPLKKKVEVVTAGLQLNGASKRDLQAFRALASNPNAALSIDRLHGVIHSRYALPTASELRTGWAEVQVAFTKIWE
ncbi:hypothetical protein C1O66_10730 [Paucibacter aquatile]|uniref:ParB/Sulfiredoxin domain-containing protein n=1 Tax=Kinneretia aquatilis TaxID=2070761 RepID=A0A2N8KWX6_9BURK|nr:hypothetical protein [Paucibacter aquatile]PND37955.1 hypothetical protein C1O66_10730 [Paucibacter aquatile]